MALMPYESTPCAELFHRLCSGGALNGSQYEEAAWKKQVDAMFAGQYRSAGGWRHAPSSGH